MMKNYDKSVKINHNPNCPYIPDHPYRILIIVGSESGKTIVLLNLIKHQRPNIDKIYLYIKEPFESKYQLLINERKKVAIKKLNNEKAFIDYPQTIDDVYENLKDYNPTKRVLKIFDNRKADMEAYKKFKKSPIVTELILRERKLNILLVLISQSCFKVTKNIRLNTTHYFLS